MLFGRDMGMFKKYIGRAAQICWLIVLMTGKARRLRADPWISALIVDNSS